MPIFKTIPLIVLVVMALSQSASTADASSVDIQSGRARVSIDRNGRVYIRDESSDDDFYSDIDESDWIRSRYNPYSRKFYRRGLSRDRYYRAKCKSHNTSYSRYGSSTYSSTTVCR
jgi:hypothetical protein